MFESTAADLAIGWAGQVRQVVVEGLCARIREIADSRSGSVVVAIDGKSGTGKSTLAAAIADRLDALIVEGDAFFAGGTDLRAEMAEELAGICIDWRRQREVLNKLRAGQSAAFRPFDWDTFDGSLNVSELRLEPKRTVVLEGVYSARPELSDLIDLRVLLTIPDSLRLKRLLAREGLIGPWERQWHDAEAWYFREVMPRRQFDMVIDASWSPE